MYFAWLFLPYAKQTWALFSQYGPSAQSIRNKIKKRPAYRQVIDNYSTSCQVHKAIYRWYFQHLLSLDDYCLSVITNIVCTKVISHIVVLFC